MLFKLPATVAVMRMRLSPDVSHTWGIVDYSRYMLGYYFEHDQSDCSTMVDE